MAVPPWLDRALQRLQLHDRRRLLGLTFILVVACIWVAASFIVQGIEQTGVSAAVLTLIANSLFAVYLPIYFVSLRLQRPRPAAAPQAAEAEQRVLYPAYQPRSDEPEAGETVLPSPMPPPEGRPLNHDMGRRQLFLAAVIVAPLWYLAQLTFNLSLARTSVTSNTILSSTSALFTFLFSMWLLHEVFSLRKLACIGLLIAGTAMVTLADSKAGDSSSESERSVIGDMLCLLSAVIYGCYTVAIRKLLREDEETPMTLFFGFMGALILGSVGPLLLLAWALGAPLGSLSWRQLGVVVAKGLLDNVLSDYLWARAILLVGPTIATGGLSMQVPLAVALDAAVLSPPWLRSAGTVVLTMVGAVVVIVGFLGLNTGETDDEQGRQQRWEERQAALQTELGFDEEDELRLTEGPFPAASPTQPTAVPVAALAAPSHLSSRNGSPGSADEGNGELPGSPSRQDSKTLKAARHGTKWH